MVSEPDKGGPAAFPVKDIVLGSFTLPFSYVGLFLRAAWLPLALFVAASLLISSLLPPPPAPPDGQDIAELMAYLRAPGGFQEVLTYEILSLLLLVPAITVWIRLTVFGPPEDGRFSLLSLTSAELYYLVAYVLVFILSAVAMFGILIAASLAGSLIVAIVGALAGGIGPLLIQLNGIVGTVLGFATFVYISARFVPFLGGMAMGEAFDLKRGWIETKAQARPLFWSMASILGILMLTQFAILYGIGMVLPLGAGLAGGLITGLIQALAILCASVYIGRVYAYFRT